MHSGNSGVTRKTLALYVSINRKFSDQMKIISHERTRNAELTVTRSGIHLDKTIPLTISFFGRKGDGDNEGDM